MDFLHTIVNLLQSVMLMGCGGGGGILYLTNAPGGSKVTCTQRGIEIPTLGCFRQELSHICGKMGVLPCLLASYK